MVDDSEDAASMLKALLDMMGHRVERVHDGRSALAMLESFRPEVVLLDIGLPGINGLEVLTEIKKREPDILVIMITAYEDIDTVISAMKSGAYDYIIKPIQLDSLKLCIKNALDTIKLRKEIQFLQER